MKKVPVSRLTKLLDIILQSNMHIETIWIIHNLTGFKSSLAEKSKQNSLQILLFVLKNNSDILLIYHYSLCQPIQLYFYRLFVVI